MRRVGREGAAQLRKRHFVTIWAAGVLMAVPLTVPLVNLLVPILGAATFTHLFHRLEARRVPA
ncbi:Arginine/ornithine antiporter ArcD [Salipiger abyssi]|uniref:Arginine/ornithine antiporter ArcD n=2 Tax=Salipiger abyssi TaxID=1250539 RepID=A0A1P8USN6_9RHOB|nr:Arginine/ornithine antiporter ArcD [Salipiger abyssi]